MVTAKHPVSQDFCALRIVFECHKVVLIFGPYQKKTHTQLHPEVFTEKVYLGWCGGKFGLYSSM